MDLQDDQIISSFWNRYIPVETAAHDPSPCPALQEMIMLNNCNPLLQMSLKALAMTRLGWLNGDAVLSTRGRTQYGLALKNLQRALWDKTLMWEDSTLAAAYCLSIYEVFIPPSGDWEPSTNSQSCLKLPMVAPRGG